MIIRWLGAFDSTSTIYESLEYEFSDKNGKVRCAEKLSPSGVGNNKISFIPIRVKVGLLVRNKAVVRKYTSDVYSIYAGKNNHWLKKTREEGSAFSNHTEVWIKPDYIGIVIRKHTKIKPDTLRQIRKFSIERKLPVFMLCKDGQLKEVKITDG